MLKAHRRKWYPLLEVNKNVAGECGLMRVRNWGGARLRAIKRDGETARDDLKILWRALSLNEVLITPQRQRDRVCVCVCVRARAFILPEHVWTKSTSFKGFFTSHHHKDHSSTAPNWLCVKPIQPHYCAVKWVNSVEEEKKAKPSPLCQWIPCRCHGDGTEIPPLDPRQVMTGGQKCRTACGGHSRTPREATEKRMKGQYRRRVERQERPVEQKSSNMVDARLEAEANKEYASRETEDKTQ